MRDKTIVQWLWECSSLSNVSCAEAVVYGWVLYEKAVLKDFAQFMRKQLCCSLFLIKLQTYNLHLVETAAEVYCEVFYYRIHVRGYFFIKLVKAATVL